MDHQEGRASAICTELGWALQGLASILPQQADESVCLHASFIAQTPDLYKNAKQLWQLYILPFRNEKEVMRSKEDQQAMDMLESRTICEPVDGVKQNPPESKSGDQTSLIPAAGLRAPHFCNSLQNTGQSSPPADEAKCEKLRKGVFCGQVTVAKPATPNPSQFTSWEELVKATHQSLYRAASPSMTAAECIKSEIVLLKSAQYDNFTEEVNVLSKGQAVRPNSLLSALSPKYDSVTGLPPTPKWWNTTIDLTVGQVLMIVDSQLPRVMWPVDKVTKAFPGCKIWSTEVQLKNRTCTRPLAKLVVVLQVPDDDDTSP
eukprot:superscaffoldBa00002024_g12908